MVIEVIALLVLGVAAGILAGMFGIGGGVVIVPFLTSALFNFDLQTAVGTSLGALLMPVGILAAIQYYRAGEMKIRLAVFIAIGLVAGGWLGANIAFGIPVNVLRAMYGVFAIISGWRFAEPIKWVNALRGLPQPPSTAGEGRADAPPLMMIAIGVLAGVASGLFGIGGGVVIVPLLVSLLRLRQKVAISTSLAALLLPVSLPSVLTYAERGAFDLGAAALIALGLVFGAFGGARLTLSLPSTQVKRLYGVFLILIGLRFLLFP